MIRHLLVSPINTPMEKSPEQDIAAADPTAIIRTPVDIIDGINPAAAEKMATEMGFTGAQEGFCGWFFFWMDDGIFRVII